MTESPSSTPENLKMVAIGGGKVPEEGISLLEHTVEISGTEHTKVLLIPTAKHTVEGHEQFESRLQQAYADVVGTEFSTLHPFQAEQYQRPGTSVESRGKMPSPEELREQIMGSDVIFVAGGNAENMMRIWEKYSIDKLLAEAIDEGKVVSGTSAGAIAWFKGGHSDSVSFEVKNGDPWDYMYVNAMGVVDAVACPHFDSRTDGGGRRRPSFYRMMGERRELGETGIGIDNNAALVVVDGLASVIRSQKGQGAHVLYHDEQGQLVEETIATDQDDLSLRELISR